GHREAARGGRRATREWHSTLRRLARGAGGHRRRDRCSAQDEAVVATVTTGPSNRTDRAKASPAALERASLQAFLLYFLRLGTLGFGGPIALAGDMLQELVEQRGWMSAQEYKAGSAFADLGSGPLPAGPATCPGWASGR